MRAGVLYDLRRFDEAIAAYKMFLSSDEGHGSLRFAAQEGLGYCQEAKALAQTDANARGAGLDEALLAFAALQPDPKGFYRDFALYHQARIKAVKGDVAGAIELYKQVRDQFPVGPLREEVRNRLALLGVSS